MNRNQVIRNKPRSIFSELEKFFEPMQPFETDKFFNQEWIPAVDIQDEKDKFIIHADIPGVNPKDIEVHLENNILTIKGERASEEKTEKDNFVHVERSKGSFMRRFSLPDTVDPDNIDAKSKNGTLMVTLHKQKENGARKISVEEE